MQGEEGEQGPKLAIPHSLMCRQIKCDEKSPACAHCESRGFQCPGYALNVRWSRKHEMRAGRHAAKNSTIQSPARQTSPTRTQRSTSETNTTPEQAAPDQQPDSWLNFPLQWGDAIHDAAYSLLPNEELPPADASFAPLGMSEATWAVFGSTMGAMTPSLGAAEPAIGLGQLPNGNTQSPAIVPKILIPAREEHDGEYPAGAQPQSTQAEPGSHASADSGRRSIRDAPWEVFSTQTALSEYFFREVISLYCSWDSRSNIMRTIVEDTWQSSEVLHHTIQSMAAACLSEEFPCLLSVAKQEHAQALQLMQSAAPAHTHKQAILLAAMFLGHTASWLSPNDLATSMFRSSHSILKDISAETGRDTSLSFFNGTMDYWAMLLAYVTDSQQLGDYHLDIPLGPVDSTGPDVPHPYSGISYEMIRVLRDTGILIFGYRKHMSTVKFMTEKDLDVFRTALREARRLERMLLAHRLPRLSQAQDPGDPKTPLRHLELMDEAYQYTGLLQLYHVFPDLLSERYAPWNNDDILRPRIAAKSPTDQERQSWLTSLAMLVLRIVGDIPFESRTRSAQPFILVAVAGELRRDPRHLQSPESAATEPIVRIDQASIEVARARKFVSSRLEAYTHILPLRKSRMISDLINQVWAALDAGEQDVYWLDIAYQKHLGTMMG